MQLLALMRETPSSRSVHTAIGRWYWRMDLPQFQLPCHSLYALRPLSNILSITHHANHLCFEWTRLDMQLFKDHQHHQVKRKAAKQTPSTYSSLLLPWGTQTAAAAFPGADSLTAKNNHFLPPLTMPYTTSGPFAHGSATSPKYSANCISWKTFTIHFLQVVNLSSDLHPQASDKAFFTGQLLKLIKQWKRRWLFHPRIIISYLFLIPRGRFLFPTSVAGFMHANKRKSGWRTRGSKAKQK